MTQYVALQNPVTYDYDKDYTIQCTSNRTNQRINHISDHVSGITNLFLGILRCCCGPTIQLFPNEDVIVTQYGMITEILRKPGFYSLNGLYLKTYTVYVGNWRHTFTDQENYDRDGVPCWVSAYYDFKVVDPIAAQFNTRDHKKFVRKSAKIALQKALGNFQRDSWQDVANQAQALFQSYVTPVGVQVNGFTITAMKISQSISNITAKQKAQAFVDARKIFAEGAISTLALNLNRVEENDISFTEQQKSALACNMTYMLFQQDKLTLEFLQGKPSSEQMNVFITTHQQRSGHDHTNRNIQTG